VTFAGLGKLSGDLQQGVTADFTELLADLFRRLGSGATDASVRAAIEQRARLGAFEGFEAGAAAQQADLTGSQALTAPLLDQGVAFSIQRAAVVTERAGIVLTGASEALVSPYARLAAQILVTDAVRMGTRSSATVNGATRKQFIRLRPVQEPRAHSILEGKIIGVDELFNIGGYMVYGPGAAELPWSEKAFCGHILKFLP